MLKILDDVCTPTKGSKYSACIDLYAREDVVIGAGETVKVPLGVCVELFKSLPKLIDFGADGSKEAIEKMNKFKQSHYLQLEPRSSLRAKGIQAGTGIIDLDYKDEIMIILHNPYGNNFIGNDGYKYDAHIDFRIKKGEKIAQIMLCEHHTQLFGIETQEERTGGFGSTGK